MCMSCRLITDLILLAVVFVRAIHSYVSTEKKKKKDMFEAGQLYMDDQLLGF